MKQICLFIVLSCFSLIGYAAISADIDNNHVHENESFTLTLLAEGGSPDGAPDLSVLENDFEVSGTRQSNQYSVINGSMTSSKSYVITLTPKHSGNLSVPSISWGNEATQPISLTVGNAGNTNPSTGAQTPAASNAHNDKAFFEASVDNPEVYLQGQFIYTQRFYYVPQLPVRSAEPEPLNLKDALVEPLSKKWNQSEKEVNGVTYNVLEMQYAIYPQVGGKLIIPSQHFTIAAGGAFFSNPKNYKFSSEEHRINVLPPATNMNPWLPAQAITITESWSKAPENLKVGDSITRTLTIEAQGLSSSQLPPLLPTQLDHVKIYPDQPQLINTPGTAGISSTRIESMAIVPTEGGEVKLPEIKLSWWDTQTNQVKTASVAARTLAIAGNPAVANITQPPVATDALPKTQAPTITKLESITHLASSVWYVIVGMLAALLVLISFLLWRTEQQVKRLIGLQKVTADDLSSTNDKNYQAENELFAQLISACQNNDPKNIKTCLILWLTQLWGTEGVPAQSDITKREPTLAPLLNEIDKVLYAGNNQPWQHQQSWLEILKMVRTNAKNNRSSILREGKNNILDALYPANH